MPKLARAAPPVPLGSTRSRASCATALPIGIGDPTSTSQHRNLFHASHSVIDGTTFAPTPTSTSCNPIATSDEIAMATGGGPWTNMISDENDDVDAISLSCGFQWPLDDLGTQTKVAKAVPKRAGNYTHEEDIQLCMSWENISTDPIIANEQPGRAYWKRIADHYYANKTFESDRNANSLEHRWSTIHKECQKFQRYCDEVERLHPSGMPYREHILAAQTLFAKGPLKKSFRLLHCWLKVRHCQKFQTIENNRRSQSNMSSNGATEGDDGDDSGRSYSIEPNPNKRPIGKKQAKERLKSGADTGPYKEAIEELILDKEEKKLREVRWEEEKKLKEERWKDTKMIHQQKILLKEKKLMWEQEQKIMFCDVTTLDPDQKTYVLAMRAQIAAQKMAAFSAASGCSGGDANGAAI